MMEIFKVGYKALLDNLAADPEIYAQENAALSNSNWDGLGVFGGVGTQAGEMISPIRAQEVPAFFACVKVLSEDVGKLPLIPYKRLGIKEREFMAPGAITRVLLKKTSPHSVPMTFKQLLTGWAVAWGNGYAEIVRNSRGEPTEMWPIHPSRVQIRRDSAGDLIYLIRFQNGTTIPIPAEDILHIRGPGDELYGWNLPVSVAKETLGVGRAQVIFAASFFGNSIIPSAVLSHPSKLKPEGQRRLRESMNRFYAGARNSAKMLVLDEDMKYSPVSMPLKQAQFLESRGFQVEEIARYFRMPLHKIQSMKQSTNNNIEQQALEYVQDALMPWLIRWEEEVNLKFFPNTGQFFVNFELDEMLRGDFETRTEGYSRMFAIGAWSINEIRAKENMNPIEGGDTHFVPLNAVPLEQALEPREEASQRRDNRVDQIDQKFRPVIHAVTTRLVNKETRALGRAHLKSPDICATTMEKFYERHELDIVESLLPHFSAYISLLPVSMTEEDMKSQMGSLSERFCGQALEKITAAVAGSETHIQNILDDFKLNRAQSMTDEIVAIGLARV